ncbi:hypothetical protein pipiens_001552 [Culex pipiens pipiens]|uniref:Uncharacterized protein n=1 Tax=Culex pipiens pipiens TaxID=38569 RepID=A0ABD1CL84_CULPP
MQTLKTFITTYITKLREFDVNSDYFCLVDTIHTLFAGNHPASELSLCERHKSEPLKFHTCGRDLCHHSSELLWKLDPALWK